MFTIPAPRRERATGGAVPALVTLLALVTGPLLPGALRAATLDLDLAALQQAAQEKPDSARGDTIRPIMLNPINVTATRDEKEVFRTAAPVSVVDTQTVREMRPNNAADLLTRLPGVDINGVGANQQRPTIRGQRGQRILLLENGLRLNNARRQADFGELPSIVDINSVERVEVVRGPASVLYGSDAIGGVINLIRERAPAYGAGDALKGRLNFSYRDAGEQVWPNGEVRGRSGRVGYAVSASFRDTKEYEAPSGSFGDITLEDDVKVRDTGVEDQNYGGYLDYALSHDQKVWGSFDFYRAEDAGFGFVSNEDLGQTGAPDIVIRYPDQTVLRATAGYRGANLGLPFADRIDVSGSWMDNERDLTFDVFVPFDPTGATGVTVEQNNFTELRSFGGRAELSKHLGRHLLTYGFEYFRDDSENTDFTRTTTAFAPPPVPPAVSEDSTPTVPNATYDRRGAFAQIDLRLHDRLGLIVGGRYQNDEASPEATPNLEGPVPAEATYDEFVGAANVLVEVLPSLNLVGSVGRGFRSPNLIELFFSGATPEGSGFQVANPDLSPETSWNFDAGVKYRRERVAFEGYYFRNEISDGIRISATGDSVGPFPSFQNVNVDDLTVQGVELLAEYMPIDGLTLGVTYTYLDGDDENDPNDENNPIAETFSSRVTGEVTYRRPSGRWWASWQIRHNGDQSNADFVIGSPIGDVLPSFTVMDLRGGVRLVKTGRAEHHLMLGIENLTDELYAEFSNATFFRPNPERSLVVSWMTSF
ncbi:MAG: TonB-dependent receptor [Gemmatimonadota bacterium]|nr:TonB-dependent receptor [Gemmatimonadota bacterium]